MSMIRVQDEVERRARQVTAENERDLETAVGLQAPGFNNRICFVIDAAGRCFVASRLA